MQSCGGLRTPWHTSTSARCYSQFDDPSVAAALKVAPAAMKLHHAYRSGLLEHLVSLCGLAEALLSRYPRLNRDLLIAGVVLHDIGKIEELGTSRRLGYTTRGHHGEIEKGALRTPMFPEALALSIMDLLDARLEQAWRLIDQGPAGDEWTPYVPSLERQLYRWYPLKSNLQGPNGLTAAAAKAASGARTQATNNGHN